ncbi:MAG: Na+/H+ antiporter subunit E [Alsobacter sp.]
MQSSIGMRFAMFLAAWLVLTGWSWADAAAGLAAAACATAVSLRVAPGRARLSPLGLLAFAGRFLAQSLSAGLDVARRAFAPDVPLRTGFVEHRTSVPPGAAREALAAVMSLQPGTLPVRKAGDVMTIHCLDTSRPVAEQLAADEASFRGAVGGAAVHG